MRTPTRRASALLLSFGLTLIPFAGGAIVNVTGVSGHNGGNWPSTLGHLTDMVNATNVGWATSDHNPGIDTSADPTDPSTWINNSGTWQSEWLGDGRLDSTTSANNKIGWVTLDLGSVTSDLENLYIWSGRYNSTGEDVRDFNVYYSSGVGINAIPATPNSKSWAGGSQANADYDFSVGDWTQIGSTATLPSPSSPYGPDDIIDLGGVSARYIGIEILTAENGTIPDRVGFAQIEITQVPEPGSLVLLGLGCLATFRRRR